MGKRIVFFTLPVYYVIGKRKPKTVLMSLNWWRNAHFQVLNKAKQHYHTWIEDMIDADEKLRGRIKVTYTIYMKNKQADGSNVGSLMSKFFLDAVVKIKLLHDDNVTKVVREDFIYTVDKDDPRCDIILEEMDREDF